MPLDNMLYDPWTALWLSFPTVILLVTAAGVKYLAARKADDTWLRAGCLALIGIGLVVLAVSAATLDEHIGFSDAVASVGAPATTIPAEPRWAVTLAVIAFGLTVVACAISLKADDKWLTVTTLLAVPATFALMSDAALYRTLSNGWAICLFIGWCGEVYVVIVLVAAAIIIRRRKRRPGLR